MQKLIIAARGFQRMSRKYKNPPLIEAVCEFQFAQKSEWDIAIPGLIYGELKGDFPIRVQVPNEIGFTMTPTPEGGSQPQVYAASDRIQFYREDKKALVQVGPHLLTINHLKPYPTWEDYLPLIRHAYSIYRNVAQPEGLERIGLRYINRLDIPDTNVELEDYFQFYPHIGTELPQNFGSFIVGGQFIFGDTDALKVQMASAQPERPSHMGVVLDLDYSTLAANDIKLENAHEWLQVAHDRLEQAFEACLTDKLRAIFEEDPK